MFRVCVLVGFFLLTTVGVSAQKALDIYHLTDSFYVYTTWGTANNNPFPANSMYLVTNKGVVMFDTPWDSTQFQPLLDSIEKRHHQKVVLCIATHFHSDRTAGLAFLNQMGIPTYSSKLTYDLCYKRHEHQAQFYFSGDTTFNVGDRSFRTFYAGPGHSPDNIVIWFGRNKIIYGGCLVKSVENSSIGNIEDSNLVAWPKTIRKVTRMFPFARFVIPGHLGWQPGSLKHTLKLIKQYKRQHS
jgi:metallo-beta-lactamase class B